MKSKFNFRRLLQLCVVTLAFNAPSSYGVTETYNTAGTFNWVCPGGVTTIQVECWGGGGAGGGAKRTGSANAGGGGGGGGAYATRTAVPVTPGQTYEITIPAAATCPTTFTNDARYNGSAVTFTGNSGVVVTAAGGTGGQSKVAAASILTGTLGAGGTAGASAGDTIFAGGSGSTNTSSNGGAGGSGASDLAAGNNATGSTAGAMKPGSDSNHNGGAGGAGRTADNVGIAGTGPGGGGGGAKVATASTTRIGGAGGLGQITLTYTIPPNFKANNTDNLDQTSSWTAYLPNALNIAEWNNLVAGANTISLGTDLSFAGIRISDPGGPVTINAGNVLTLGGAAVDLDLSAATQNLTVNSDLVMSAANVWNVAATKTLTLGGAVSGSAPITKQGSGTAELAGPVTHTGATTVAAGALTIKPTGSITTASNILLTVSGASAVANIEGSYTSTGGGGIAINSGGILNTSGTVAISGANTQALFLGTAAGSGTWNVTGGSVSVNYTSNGWGIGNTNGTGTLDVSAGSVTTAATNVFNVGHGAGATGVLTVSGTGLVTVNAGAGAFNIGANATSTGTVNLNGGTLALGRNITKNASSTATFNFNGGLLQAGLSSATYMNGLTNANVRDGGAKIDTNNFNVTIGQALIHSIIGGDAAIDGGLTKSGLGTLTLTGTNTYTGATLISGGTLALSGTGEMNGSSGITINGIDAKFNHTGSLAVSPIVTVTQGTLTGSGTVNTVNVGAGTGGIISNNNGVAGASLTIGALSFDGAATVNTFGNTSAPIVTTSIATNVAGMVTINPSATTWAVGTPYDLITYGGGSIGGAGFAQFQLGAVTGASPRQSKILGNTGTAITLTVGADDVPYWVGDGDGKWNLASTNNWKLTSDNSYTTFLAGDNVLFNDSATGVGPIAVDIDVANVVPTSTTFNNSAKNYTLGSTGGFGISTGSLTKSGTGSLTITTANTYSGNTIINGGVLDISTDGAQLYSGASPVASAVTVGSGGVLVVKQFAQGNTVGSGSPSLGNLNNSGGQVVIDGGTLRFNNETGARGRVIDVGPAGATLDVVNNSTYTWTVNPGASIPFTGTGQTLTLTGDASSTGKIDVVIGGTDVSLLKTGASTWTLAGTNTYTGNTTISAGTLSMGANRITTSPTIFIGDGATWNSTGGLTLAANQIVTGTGTTGSVTTTASTGLITTSDSTISSSGTLSITRLSILGTGNLITGGNIQSGGSATNQRGLLVGNAGTGVLTITGGTLTTNGSAANSDVLGNTASTGDGTLVINGGNYVASGSGQLNLGNGSASGTLTVTSGNATVSTLIYNGGTTGTETSAIVNLDGGTLTLNNIVVTSGTTKEFNFNGGQLIAGANFSAFSGLTMNVKDGGANINTNGFSLGISDPLLNSGIGGLSKSGLGTLTLSGVNTYAGGTSVTAGALRFSTAATSATDVTVSGGAEAGVLVAADNAQWVNTGNLTLQNNGAALVDYGSTVPSITVAPVSVTNFVFGTTPGVKLAGASAATLAVGQTYPLITWTGTGPVDGTAFDLRTHRLSGTFSVVSNTLYITITKNAIAPIAWNTGDGIWNTSTANWVDDDLVATNYVDLLDTVIFGDAAGVTGNPIVTLATAVSPVSMTMNTTGRNYTITGAGSIGGTGALNLAATNVGTFTLATANNSFSGGTIINGGTLSLGDATNTLLDTGSVVVDGATSILSLGANSDTVGAVSLKNGAAITGSGTLTGSNYAFESGSVSANLAGTTGLAKTTSGTVILSGANTFTGSASLTGGTLRLANTAALANAVNILMTTASLSLELGTDTPFTTLPLVSGGSGAFTYTLVSDRATAGEGLTHQLSFLNFGSATFDFISGTNVTSGTAGISVSSSNLTSGSAGTAILNPTSATLTITGDVTSAGNNVARTLRLDGTGTGHSIGGVITQSVASALSLTKTNTSTWTLSGVNSYAGATTINQGTLAFSTTDQSLTGGLTFGSTAGSTNVGTLDLSNASATFGAAALVRTNSSTANTITVGVGKTLTLNGGLTIGYDPGSSPATTTKLTVDGGGSMAVNGTTITIGQGLAANNAGYTSTGTLDVTSLASFSADVTNFNLGVGLTDGTGSNGILLLSNTANTLIATTLKVGDTLTENGGGGTTTLTLGTGTNVIQADTIDIGKGKGSGTGYKLAFASQTTGSPGTVSISNKLGSGAAAINIANMGSTGTGGNVVASLDLRGHVSTVNASTLLIAQSNNGTGTNVSGSNGTVSFDAGTFTVGTLNMGLKTGASTGTATGRIDVGGGTFTVNTAFTLGSHAGSGASVATLNLTGGTFTSNTNITRGGGNTTSTINLEGGTLDMTGKNIGSANTVTLNAKSGNLSNVAEINNGGGWTKSTTGTLILAGTNNYTGTATVNGGTLSVTGSLNPLSALAVGNSNLTYSGAAPQTVSSLTINSGYSTVTNTNAGATNVLNVGAITRNPGGIVNFANATASNNVIQTTTPNTNGILGPWAFVGSDLAMNDGSNNIVAYSSYTDVTRLSSGSKAIANDSVSNVRIIEGSGSVGDITMAASGTTVVNTLLQSDSGGTGAANLDIGNGNTLQTNNILQASTAGTLTVGVPATTALLQPVIAGGDLSLVNNSTNALRVNAIIADNTSASILNIAGSGSTVLTGVNTYSGTTNINIGSTLQLGDGTSGNDGTISNSLSVVNNGALVFNRFASSSYDGVISGTGTVTKDGNGTQTLNGANTYTGGTTISAGTLALGTGGSLVSTGAVIIAPSAVLENAGTTTQTLSGAITGGGTLLLSGTGQFLVNNVGNAYGAVNVTNAGRFIVNTNAAGLPAAATVSISGGGILLTSVGTSYANAITLGNTGGLSTRFAGGTTYSNVTLPGTGTVILNNDDSITTALTISNGQTLTGNLTVQVGGHRMTGTTASLGAATLSGILTGSGGLTLTSAGNIGNSLWGTGSLILTGANDYVGGTTINQGTLTVGTGGTLGANTGALSVNNTNTVTDGKSVVLNLASGVDTTVGSLSGAIATPTGGTNTVTINNGGSGSIFTVNQTTAGTYAGVIAGGGDFVLGTSSTNTLTLTGANTYTGTTTVAAGTLALVGGSQASPITVNSGASLGFTLDSPTTSTSSFNLSAGTIKITGSPTLNSYDLITSSSGITGTPVLDAPIAGYKLKVEGSSLKLVKDGYASWAAINAIGSTPGQDKDGDGVPNAIEYVLGGSVITNDLDKLPKSSIVGTNFIFTFFRKAETADAATAVTIEVDTDLSGWETSYVVPDTAVANNPGVTVVEDVPTGFDTITLTVPMGTDPKKFARLFVKVTE